MFTSEDVDILTAIITPDGVTLMRKSCITLPALEPSLQLLVTCWLNPNCPEVVKAPLDWHTGKGPCCWDWMLRV